MKMTHKSRVKKVILQDQDKSTYCMKAIANEEHNLAAFVRLKSKTYSGMWLANFEKEGNWARGLGPGIGVQGKAPAGYVFHQ